MASAAPATEKDKSKVHKLSLKGSSKLVAEFVSVVAVFLFVARRQELIPIHLQVSVLDTHDIVRSAHS